MAITPTKALFSELELRKATPGTRLTESSRYGPIFGAVSVPQRTGELQISWTFRYVSPITKKRREAPCGRWPKHDMKTIRTLRDRLALLVKDGEDPLLMREAKKLEKQRKIAEEFELKAQNESKQKTVKDLFEVWFEREKANIKTKDDVRWQCEKYIVPTLGSTLISELTEDAVVAMLTDLASEHPRTCKQAHTNLRSMFTFADARPDWRALMTRHGNPVALIKINKILPRDYSPIRTRVLSVAEIKQLDKVLHNIRTDYSNVPSGEKYQAVRPIVETTECAIWIMIATLCRVGELTKARWENVDLKKKVWHIPREDVKELTGGVHQALDVNLSDFALAVFKRLHKLTSHTQYLFPAKPDERGEIRGHVGETTFTKQISNRQSKFSTSGGLAGRRQDNTLVLGKENWTSHDLRRTGATLMQELKIPAEVIDCCQNHVLETGTRRHYFQFEYEKEKLAAWKKLGTLLKKLAPNATAVH